jgi:hypothetical protein
MGVNAIGRTGWTPEGSEKSGDVTIWNEEVATIHMDSV